MERLEPRTTVGVPIAALALAAGAAASFWVAEAVGFLSDAAESVFVVTWLLGWMLLAWAGLIAGGYAILLGVRSFSRRAVSRLQVALAAAALALIVMVVATHPLWGVGSGVGG